MSPVLFPVVADPVPWNSDEFLSRLPSELRVSFPLCCSYAEVSRVLFTLNSPIRCWKGKTYRHNAPRTALGETGTFVDAVVSFSAFFLAFCFAAKPPVWFGCFPFTLLFYNNARPLLSSFLFSIVKYFIFVLQVKPCIIFSFLLFLPLA